MPRKNEDEEEEEEREDQPEQESEKLDPKTSKVADNLEQSLLDHRRVFLCGPVDNASCSEIIKKLWYLELKDPGKPILFVINSPGGAVDSGYAIYDQVKLISSPVTTLITGLAASMGSILSLCAAPGRRFATKRSRIMIHQPLLSGVIQGQATDLEIQAKEMLKTRNALIQTYVDATGKDFAVIEKAVDRDTWMTAQEALEYGLLDKVIDTYKEIF